MLALGLLCPSLPHPIRVLSSDASTALLDRNCESQLLGSRSGHRDERHVFKFRTYLKNRQPSPPP